MAAKIQLLSEHTINQIAAGEVIENPASLVKELVENALDAGATKIIIEVFAGGLQKVKVSDDGIGMDPDDAILCLQRHATSKIQSSEDLWKVMTMGFRGEALASIAAVSKMTLQTVGPLGQGTKVQVEGGVITEVTPCARNQGTSIEVRNLFYNVPARRKFQKSPSACLAEVTKACVVLSLAHPFISFELHQQDQEILALPKETGSFLDAVKQRAKRVLGEEFSEDFLVVDIAMSPFSLKGVIGSLGKSRPSKSGQYQFVNTRAVLCPAISYAIKDALGTRLEEGKFPVYVLHLEIAPQFVDVNVHPQKKEIRLLEEKWIREQIKEQLRLALVQQESPLSHVPVSEFTFSDNRMFMQPQKDIFDAREFSMAPQTELQFFQEPEEIPSFVFEKRPEVVGLYSDFLWVDALSVALSEFSQEGLLFIDLKAAKMRVLFDSFVQKEGSGQQMLLFPFALTGSLDELKEIASSLEILSSIGFSLREVRNEYFVEAIPPSLGEAEALTFLRDYLFAEDRGSFLAQKKDRKLAIACSRLVSGRQDRYTAEGAIRLLQELLKTSSPFTCPFGEKIITFVGKNDLQQLFFGKRK